MAQLTLDTSSITRGDGLVDQAYTVIRDAILSRRLAPGSRLSVPEIARQLDISRSPVREAIARIEYEGLAESVSHRGAVVVEIGLDELVGIYDLREVLEGLAARLATRAADPTLIDDLEQNWQGHHDAVDSGDVERHMELDAAFHRRIREAGGNLRLSDHLRQLQGQIRVAMSTTVARRGGMHAALAEHRALIDAIRGGDPANAETVARDHITRLRESLHDAALADQHIDERHET
ncbi:GntR family transcriptional regulator [Brachybacterium sacelli]|uniref:DNA-binding GntR family transcriptional regulator n=1 Tax=Brachybacterium sacelli TaxID=173364 RepID=A0ABS4WZ58_9MICO|nr:GntR family transcriptional regulator [Brachybacterium sacelli]MBP2381499.1 DNA-binding GntR family transcriptional regulator [Brachybacterium sacelli]